MAKCKKLKVDRQLKTTANEDIISNLPDSLLHHIISFLETKLAVSTCILSKRWEHLWKATTKLSFSSDSVLEEQIDKFPLFVDQVLLHHSSNITTFFLYKSESCYVDASILKSWISAAVNRQVQEVHLLITSQSVLSLPLSFWNSNTLTVLIVSSSGCCLQLPSKICLSSLRSLHLLNVKFRDDLSFNRLFSSLPKIEELELWCDQSNCPKNGTISLPTLRRLSLILDGAGDINTHIIKVNAENLVYLYCRCNFTIDLFLDRMPSLSEGNMNIIISEGWEREAYRVVNLLAGFCYAKSLKINGESLGALQRLKSQVNFNFFPTFINLAALKINSRVTSNAAPQLIDIFRTAPTLESVVIQEVYGGNWSRKPYPQCIECSLRNCSVLRFGGRQADILFVKFVLKAAKGLERLELCCTQCLCRQEKKLKKVMNELNTFPRASNCCVIKFVTS